MEHWLRSKWIETVLSKFDRNAEIPMADNQEPLACQVLNIKVLDKAINGIGGMAEVHDNKLYIKALFTVDAITRFEEKEELTSCAEFSELRNSILALTRYHIMTDVPEDIEQSDIAICVEDFSMSAYKVSPGVRRIPLQRALENPTVMQDLRRMWRAKYRPDEPDTCFSHDQSQESPLAEKSALSQLLEAMEASYGSQQASEVSEAEQGDEDQVEPPAGPGMEAANPPSKTVYIIEFESTRFLDAGLETAEALRQAVKDVKTKLIVVKDFPELASDQSPEYLQDTQGFSIEELPTDQVKDFAGVVRELAELEIPEDAMEKLTAIEEWKAGYKPPSSLPLTSSPSNEPISFVSEPSVDDQAQEALEDVLGHVTQRRPKRKLSFEKQFGSPCKMARNLEGGENSMIETDVVDVPFKSGLEEPAEKIPDGSVPEQEDVTQMSELEVDAGGRETTPEQVGADGKSSRSNESCSDEDVMAALCACLTPTEEKGEGDGGQTHPQEVSFVSDADSTNTSLLVSCVEQSPEGDAEQGGDEDKLDESVVVLCQTPVLDSNSTTESPEEDTGFESKEAFQIPSKRSERSAETSMIKTASNSSKKPQTIDCLESETHHRHVSVEAHQKSSTSRPRSELSSADTGTSEAENTSDCPKRIASDAESRTTVQEQLTSFRSSKASSRPVNISATEPSSADQENLPVASNTRDPRVASTSSRTVKQGSFSSVRVKPLSKTPSSTSCPLTVSKSKEEGNECRPITQLCSPSIVGSIPTPICSLTSYQPPKMCVSEASSSKSTEGQADSPGVDHDEHSHQLNRLKIEDYILEWCTSYFASLNRV